MGQVLHKWRVPLAGLFTLTLIVGAFVLARGIQTPRRVEASPETALLNAIASRDSDADGLPDWEEALYGTSPYDSDTNTLGMTDGEAVAKGLIVPKAVADALVATSSGNGAATFVDPALGPVPPDNSLTAAFSKQFLAAYLSAKQAAGGGVLSRDGVNGIANQVIQTLSDSVTAAPKFKTAKDLTISDSGPDSLRKFAADAEAVLLKNKSDARTGNELDYLAYAIGHNNDPRALAKINSLAKMYRETAMGLAVLPVPQELVEADLELINVFMRKSEIASDFARITTDPLATMLAFYQYPKTAAIMMLAFVKIGRVYNVSGATIPSGAPGSLFANLIANVVSSIEAAEKP